MATTLTTPRAPPVGRGFKLYEYMLRRMASNRNTMAARWRTSPCSFGCRVRTQSLMRFDLHPTFPALLVSEEGEVDLLTKCHRLGLRHSTQKLPRIYCQPSISQGQHLSFRHNSGRIHAVLPLSFSDFLFVETDLRQQSPDCVHRRPP